MIYLMYIQALLSRYDVKIVWFRTHLCEEKGILSFDIVCVIDNNCNTDLLTQSLELNSM